MKNPAKITAWVFFAISSISTGCEQSQPVELVRQPLAVLYTRPMTEEIADYAEFVGQTEACASVEVRARVTGFLEKIGFRDGEDVKAGDLLFEVDHRLYLAELERAEAVLAQANARLQRVTADLHRAEALTESSAITQEQYDLAAGAYSEAIARTQIADGARRLAQLNLDYCRVAAPLSGRASRALVDPGSLIKQDQTVLTSIVATDPIEIYLDIDESTLMRVRRLIQAGEIGPLRENPILLQVRLADEVSSWHEGAIDFIDNRLDPTTGTVRVRGIVANPDRLFAPGMFVRARLQIRPPKTTVLITERALGTERGEKFCYVIGRGERVVYRPVKTGRLIGGRRVIKEGLSTRDRVLVSGLQRVRPNMKVSAKSEGAQKSS